MPLVSAGIALAIQTVVLFVLILATDLGVHALVICSVLYSVLIFLIDSRFICQYLRMHLRVFRVYGRPVAAAIVMGAAAKLAYEGIRLGGMMISDRTYFINLFATAAAIAVAIPVYFFVLIKVGGLKKNDILQAPKGARILGVLQKAGWM